MFGYGAGLLRAGRHGHRPGQRLRRPRPSGCCAGVIGIDSEAGPTEIAILADDTADPVHVAADLISQAEHDPLAGAVLVTDSEALADAVDCELVPGQVAADQALRPDHRRRSTARQSGVVLVDDLDAGPAGRRRLRRRAPGDPDRGTPRAVADAGAQRRRDLRRRLVAGVAGRLLRRLQPRAAHRRLRPALLRACRVQSFLRGIHVVEYDEQALRRGRRARRRPRRAPRTCPRTRAAVRDPAGPADDVDSTSSRCGRSCAAARPTARRSWTCRYGSTPTRTRTRCRPSCSPTWATALGHAAAGPQPLPRPGRRRAARRPGRLPDPHRRRRRSRRSRSGRPTAPTRCCSSSCRPSAAPGARRWASRRRTRCTRSSPRGTGTGWVAGHRARGLHHRRRGGRRAGRASCAPDVVFVTSPNNPTGTARGAGDDRRRSTTATEGVVVVDEAYAEFARAGHAVGADPAARPPAADRQPDDEQGVRHGRAAAGLPGRRPGGGRRAAAGAAAVPPVSSLTQAAARAALAHTDALLATSTRSRRSATGSSPRCRRWG